MKKIQLMKFVVFVLFFISIIFLSNYVNADDNTTKINDITNLIRNSDSSSSNTDNSNSESSNNSTNTDSANTNTGINTNSGGIANPSTNTNNTNSTSGINTNNSSNYNNTNLPHTGIIDSTGTVIFLVIIFIVSALYAYKKINDYRGL